MAMIIEQITENSFGEELNRIINEPTGLDIKSNCRQGFDDRTSEKNKTLTFNSDRSACIARIKETGYDEFAIEMAESRRQTIKRKA
jgi:hypothetical protein